MNAALFVLATLVAQEGFGGEPANTRSEYRDIEKAAMRKRIAQDRVKRRFLKREEVSILEGLSRIDRLLRKRHDSLKDLSDRERKLEVQIDRAGIELEKSKAELERLREHIGRRASAMLRLQRTQVSDLLPRTQNGGSFVESRRLRDSLRKVLRYDVEVVQNTRRTAEKAELLGAQLFDQRAALEVTRRETRAEIATRHGLREERAALLKAVRSERHLLDRLTKEVRSAAKKLDRERNMIRGIVPPPPPRSGGFERQRGRLQWPVAGRVELTFGKRVDPPSGMIIIHRGIDIRAPFGESIRSPFAGKVAFSSRLAGFGNLVIIDHGKRWYTIYGHLESTSVARGDRVQRGQVIGLLGDHDSDKGAYLYFEIRRGRRAIDPLSWLAP